MKYYLASRDLRQVSVRELALFDGQMAPDQAPADDGLWHGHAEVLREFHSTRQALRVKDLHHTNRITQLPTEAVSSKAPSENALLEQIKNDVGSFFETAHP